MIFIPLTLSLSSSTELNLSRYSHGRDLAQLQKADRREKHIAFGFLIWYARSKALTGITC